MKFTTTTLAAIAASATMIARSDAGTITAIYGPTGTPTFASTFVTGVSADGSTVTGSSSYGVSEVAFRWTAATGSAALANLSTTTRSNGTAVSGDGSTVVGWSINSSSGRSATRWTSGGISDLGVLPSGSGANYDHRSIAANTDGSVIAGYYRNASSFRPFRWTSTGGMQALSTANLPTGIGDVMTTGISADGSMIVGGYSGYNGSAYSGAWRWTQSNGMQSLGNLGTTGTTTAFGVSADGSTIVGQSANQAFRWTSGGGMVSLGSLGTWTSSRAIAASADGSTIVGWASSSNAGASFIWTSAGGMQGLAAYLASNGINVAPWSNLNIQAISADGRTFVGAGSYGGQTVGFVATIPGPGAIALLGVAGAALARRRRG